MTKPAIVPAERILMSELTRDCPSASYLRSQGLPRRLEWSFPIEARHAEHHSIDFGGVANPTPVIDLFDSETPLWYRSIRDWDSFMVIGTWKKRSRTGITTAWKICMDSGNGEIFRMETSAAEIINALKGHKELAAHFTEGILTPRLQQLAISECVSFMNSSPLHMMECFDKYFAFVNSTIDSAESFLDAISQIDLRASASGAIWHSLVADYLGAEHDQST